MKTKPTMTAKEWERISAELGIPMAPPDHPMYREPPCVALFSGNLVPGIVSEAPQTPPPAAEASNPPAPARDPLTPPLRENFVDDECYDEALGYWNTHVGRVLALRQQYMSPKKDEPPALPGQPA